MDIKTLKEKLDAGVVAFKYIKKSDGSERYAIGTTNSEIIDKLQGVGKRRELQAMQIMKHVVLSVDYPAAADKAIMELGGLPEPSNKKAKAHNDSVQTYFDLQVMGFRTFSVDSELSFIA